VEPNVKVINDILRPICDHRLKSMGEMKLAKNLM